MGYRSYLLLMLVVFLLKPNHAFQHFEAEFNKLTNLMVHPSFLRLEQCNINLQTWFRTVIQMNCCSNELCNKNCLHSWRFQHFSGMNHLPLEHEFRYVIFSLIKSRLRLCRC